LHTDKLEAAGVTPLLNLLGEFGGWPLVKPADWNEGEFNWIQSVGELRRRLLDTAIISVYAELDLKNTSKWSVWVGK